MKLTKLQQLKLIKWLLLILTVTLFLSRHYLPWAPFYAIPFLVWFYFWLASTHCDFCGADPIMKNLASRYDFNTKSVYLKPLKLNQYDEYYICGNCYNKILKLREKNGKQTSIKH